MFPEAGAWTWFVSKAPTARRIDIGITMNITGIDLLMTALSEERWLHIVQRLLVVRIKPRILYN
jgi:hypothetical protein